MAADSLVIALLLLCLGDKFLEGLSSVKLNSFSPDYTCLLNLITLLLILQSRNRIGIGKQISCEICKLFVEQSDCM